MCKEVCYIHFGAIYFVPDFFRKYWQCLGLRGPSVVMIFMYSVFRHHGVHVFSWCNNSEQQNRVSLSSILSLPRFELPPYEIRSSRTGPKLDPD